MMSVTTLEETSLATGKESSLATCDQKTIKCLGIAHNWKEKKEEGINEGMQ